MNSSLRNLLYQSTVAVLFLSLTGCASQNTYTAPQFAALRAAAESDLQSDVIMGMWYRAAQPGVPGSEVSILFRRNGMGIVKQGREVPNVGFRQLEPVRFNYEYKGGGLWLDSMKNEYWIANGFLVRNAKTIFTGYEYYVDANIRDVLTRVE